MATKSIKFIIDNPNSSEFQNRYLPLGKKLGKDKLKADCRTYGARLTLAALIRIEKGYSHKCKITYENDITRWDYDIGRLAGPENPKAKLANRVNKGLKNGDIDPYGRVVVKKDNSNTTKQETPEEKQARLTEETRIKREEMIQKRKQKKMDVMKKKMSELDSWEDF